MPHTSTPTERHVLLFDELARGRAAQLLQRIKANYAPPPRAPYVGKPAAAPEVVDLAYVLTGAVQVGLNRWTLPASQVPPAELFTAKVGVGVLPDEVDVMVEDIDRASKLAAHLHVDVLLILSCALCTGIAMLAGDGDVRGPFEV